MSISKKLLPPVHRWCHWRFGIKKSCQDFTCQYTVSKQTCVKPTTFKESIALLLCKRNNFFKTTQKWKGRDA